MRTCRATCVAETVAALHPEVLTFAVPLLCLSLQRSWAQVIGVSAVVTSAAYGAAYTQSKVHAAGKGVDYAAVEKVWNTTVLAFSCISAVVV